MNIFCPPAAIRSCVFAILLAGLSACGSAPPTVRIATFNTALSRDAEGVLHAAFAAGDDQQARLVAEVLQRTRPDIVLLQEVDYDPTGKAYTDFQKPLPRRRRTTAPSRFITSYVYAPPVNTGVLAERRSGWRRHRSQGPTIATGTGCSPGTTGWWY